MTYLTIYILLGIAIMLYEYTISYELINREPPVIIFIAQVMIVLTWPICLYFILFKS